MYSIRLTVFSLEENAGMCVLIFIRESFIFTGKVINHSNAWQFNCVDTGILCSVHKTCQSLLLKYGPWTIPCFNLELVKMHFLGQEV